jgi:hypothetical protein
MAVPLLLELIGGIVAVVCIVVAAKVLIGLIRLNRAAKRKAELEAMPERKAEDGICRAG